ncbi:hypothetical protein CspeluHIS016_0801850 [Cutaneotrichosporon spelunceum]|uniref:Acetyl-CoA synthetase-like protein n=1 Tax=Cutaneotrichosporon spelunceum TaxID=1672016 RepID=A0AAD3TZ77_9TREE|nr:hypothetical protein CspeluHIS016_0801850 [Cutaneotrichosporon spelunceum]
MDNTVNMSQKDTVGKIPWQECDKLICKPGTLFEIEEIEINGLKQRSWKNQAPSYRAMIMENMPKNADKVIFNAPRPEPAPASERYEVTHGEVYRQALEVAAWLRSRGVRHEDHVGIVAFNCVEWAVTWIGCQLIGAVPTMVNSSLVMDSMIHCLKITHPKIILTDAISAVTLAPYRSQLKELNCGPVVSWQPLDHLNGPRDIEVLDFEKLSNPSLVADIVAGRGGDLERLGPDSNATIFFTSGTTGYPKAVLATHRANMHNFVSAMFPPMRMAIRMGAPADAVIKMVTGPPEIPTVALLAIPFFHGTGCVGWFGKSINDGAKVVLMRRWSVKEAVKLILDQKVNLIGGVPSIAVAIMQSKGLPPNYPMKAVAFGGAAPPSRLAHDIRDQFPDANGSHGWGMTETTVLHCQHVGADYYAKPKSCGPPMPICDIRIVDENGRPVGPNQVGQIQARGPNIMKEYYGNPKATAETLDADGWLSTGDGGYLDEDGALYIADRIKDMIIRGGENISSEEVENAIYLDDRIAECASVPVPDDYLGELVAISVSLVQGKEATPASIMAAAESRLRRDARPVFVHISDSLLPRNINGKLVKADIKKIVQEAYAAHQSRAKL